MVLYGPFVFISLCVLLPFLVCALRVLSDAVSVCCCAIVLCLFVCRIIVCFCVLRA